jgi:hypothetical protein
MMTLDQAERLIGDTEGRTIAFEIATRYPKFQGVSRAELAGVFEYHGFANAAKRVVEVTAETAASDAVSRVKAVACGKQAADGVTYQVEPLRVADDHVRAWGVYESRARDGERAARKQLGARIFVAGDDVYAAAPIDQDPIEPCMVIARELVDYARYLEIHADTAVVSRCMGVAYDEAKLLPWIARGCYVAPVGPSSTDRIVHLAEDLRARYYDPATRTGIRVSAVPIKSGEKASVDALVDSVIDDIEATVADLASKLRGESGRGNVRASTFEKRRDEARALLDRIGEYEGLLGSFAERFRQAASSVEGAYAGAVAGQDLALPQWAAEAVEDDESSAAVAAAREYARAQEPAVARCADVAQAAPEEGPVSGIHPEPEESGPELDVFRI